MEKQELTFGEKAVGLDFKIENQSVLKVKQHFASLIDDLNDYRNDSKVSQTAKRHASVAITDLETAHLRTVEALTWVEV